MQLTGRLTQLALWRILTRFDRAKLQPAVAIRNTIGIVVPVVIAAALGNPSAGVVVALGALNVSYSDGRDPYGIRARRMLFSSALVGVAVVAGALSAKSNVTAVIVAALWAFGGGMMPALGQRAGDLGSMSLVTMIVFAARTLTPLEAVESGLLATAGGVLQTALSVAFWPVHRYEPERRMLSALYGTLAQLAVLPSGADAPPAATAQINESQEMVSALAGSPDETAERYIFLVNQAERIRLALLTLRRLRKRIDRADEGHEPARLLQAVLDAAAAELDRIDTAIIHGTDTFLGEKFAKSVSDLKRAGQTDYPPMLKATIRDAIQQTDLLAGRLRAAAHPGSLGPFASDSVLNTVEHWARISKLRANLSFQSTVFRHAVRLAISIAAGDAIGRAIDFERTYWIPMTIAIVLRPEFSATYSRGILRVLGTLAGLLLATGLFHGLVTGRGEEIVLMAIFVFLLRWIGPANYGVFVTALSAFIVLFIAITGVAPATVIQARASNTIIGGLIALAAYALWPTWEHTQAGTAFADLLDAYRAYFEAIMRAYQKQADSDPGTLAQARLKCRLARSNSEALMGRIVAEPGLSRDRANLFTAVLTTSHGFVRAALAIESALDRKNPKPPRPATVEFANEVCVTLDALSQSLRANRPLPRNLPDLRAAHNAILRSSSAPAEQYTLINTETDRIATSLNTLRELVEKYLADSGA
jgi:uncharacterized membrane protein YccC